MAAKIFNLNMIGYWRESKKIGLPAFTGVFFVYECSYDNIKDTVGLKRILYIGEAENINSSIATNPNFERWRSFVNINNELCFSVCYVEKMYRVQVAVAFIFKYRPVGNSNDHLVFPFDATNILIAGKTNMLLENNFTVK